MAKDVEQRASLSTKDLVLWLLGALVSLAMVLGAAAANGQNGKIDANAAAWVSTQAQVDGVKVQQARGDTATQLMFSEVIRRLDRIERKIDR